MLALPPDGVTLSEELRRPDLVEGPSWPAKKQARAQHPRTQAASFLGCGAVPKKDQKASHREMLPHSSEAGLESVAAKERRVLCRSPRRASRAVELEREGCTVLVSRDQLSTVARERGAAHLLAARGSAEGRH